MRFDQPRHSFKPENAAQLADCGISILESPADVPMTLAYLGFNPNTINPKDFDAVVKAFCVWSGSDATAFCGTPHPQ